MLQKLRENILLTASLFLVAFIPLYPKLPILDIKNTWVYIRAEDFIVFLVLSIWVSLMFLRKVSFKTPLTMPILIFWTVGIVATLHGVILIFPSLDGVYANVALLNYLRRIEYLSLFFIGYAAVKDKKNILSIFWVLVGTLFLIAFYGIGQKYLGFPAFLTMNEEFAKGIPIRLSSLSRVSSTFGGHYDLAAYLVLILPIIGSMALAFKNYFVKLILLIGVVLGFVLIFMTVSRVSFFVLLLSMVFMLFMHKKKLAIYSVLAVVLMSFVFLTFSTSLLQRFGNTFKEIDVVLTAKEGAAVGHVQYISKEQFKDRFIRIKYGSTKSQVDSAMSALKRNIKSEEELASPSALIVPYETLPQMIPLVVEPNSPTGENLPQGTGYINLTLTPIKDKIGRFYYQKANDDPSSEILAIEGDFLIKKVVAYDLSFTTRFQGEWPKALDIFKKSILFGGGYSATGLAVDNNYLRILGEVGSLGFISYFAIILFFVIYILKILPNIESKLIKSFVFGFLAGSFGLALNAVFIDVFEASKIAFSFWLLTGITLGTLHFYQTKPINIYEEFKKMTTSSYAIIIYLFIFTFASLYSITNYFLVGDDFTWFRWIADGKDSVLNYFLNSEGFFYRPGSKIYYLLMYETFWLNQSIYHFVSIFLHFLVSVLLFFISKRILKDAFLAAGASFLFLVLTGYLEAVFWISSTGFLFTSVFSLLSLLFFILWDEQKKKSLLVISYISLILGLLFHELGIVTPLFLILYSKVIKERSFKELISKNYLFLFSPLLPYFILRFVSQSHWFNGDYSYNILKFPLNAAGNAVGYLMLDFFGLMSLSLYQGLRNFSRENILIGLIIFGVISFVFYHIFKRIKKMEKEDRKIIIFSLSFFLISLLPFLGLGNITSRYSYLSSVGFVILLVFSFKKIYNYLIFNGRSIATLTLSIVIGIFVLLHISQLQKAQVEWSSAGDKSRAFLTSLNGFYEDEWSKIPLNFYFVNVPIRNGDAWVLPVGLKDAVWLIFRNEKISVYQLNSTEDAVSLIEDPARDKVFEFQDDGSLVEFRKLQNGKINKVDR